MKNEIVEKPWGHEEIWAKTDRYVGKILTINPGHRLILQYHEEMRIGTSGFPVAPSFQDN